MQHMRRMHGTAGRRPYSARAPGVRLAAALRFRAPAAQEPALDPNAREPKFARLEAALLYADEPLAPKRLADAAGLADAAEARALIERLKSLYDATGSAFQVEELAGGFQLFTRPRYHSWLARLKRTGHELHLSSAALETLAVIAYKQPIMRADVENVRGVAWSEIIRMLMETGLVRVAGRHDSLGRPQLYGTTKKFLQTFGLNTLQDLPEVTALVNPSPGKP
jgi:segregation and condensation protein B